MTFTLRDGVFTVETEYGIALLDEDRDQYWTLNPSAALILRTLLDGGSADDAVRTLTQEYAVEKDTAHRDVQELVGELRAAGLAEEDTGRPLVRHGIRRWRPEKKSR
ncbi:lasso peptide biosynthesis PqqD family chaperone [Streptomyces sp. CB03238]|uniref:lasso peptide biosynthesis PqqD family chaperone n=1 Tax=Streptomyces sp. CB03238 TaxID=1907777 RepID=UPI000A1086D8|nr:lasso peptide biosynthesis PqqD family chaperone [Streptomyces sp. CB03238]ORT59933.1 PqqD family protein [Streptomyces sp. CB03238]